MSDSNPFRQARQSRGNLLGAPLFLRPSVVRALCENMDAIARAVVQVPVLPVKLVDRPRRSEDPRLAQANDDIQEQIRQSPAPIMPPIAAIEPGRVAPPEQPSAPVLQSEQAEKAEPEDWPDAPLPEHADPALDRAEPAAPMERLPRTARKSVLMERQRRDADARAVERPALRQDQDEPELLADRREMIREAARRLADREREKQAAAARLSLGAPTHRAPLRPPPLMPEVRRRRIEAAIAFLKRGMVLVTVDDRNAQVRRYRVSGRRDAVFAEQVIELAVAQGMELPA